MSWHFDVKLLDAILDGSTRTGSQFDAEESLGAGAIKETDGDGVIEIVDGFGGEWIVDSFFDISYEIELADTRVPTEIRPGDGSVRVESHRRIRAATLDDWLPRALELELAESDVGDPHVDSQSAAAGAVLSSTA